MRRIVVGLAAERRRPADSPMCAALATGVL
jgi:hypothetical protein